MACAGNAAHAWSRTLQSLQYLLSGSLWKMFGDLDYQNLGVHFGTAQVGTVWYILNNCYLMDAWG